MATYDVKCVNQLCPKFNEVIEVFHGMFEEHPDCSCGSKLETHFSKENVKPVQFKGDHWTSKGGSY